MAAECVVQTLYSGDKCTEPAKYVVETGCVHEHLNRVGMCERHKVILLSNRPHYCKLCYDGGAGHKCQRSAFSCQELADA